MSTSAASLRRQGRRPPQPLIVQLPEGELRVRRWLRILPGKRLVGQGDLDGRPVLAKLFIAQAAGRHWRRERDGIQALLDAGLNTPTLIAAGTLEGGVHYLLTEFLHGAHTLDEQWQQLPGRSPGQPQAMALLVQALHSLAQLHRLGLVQHDLHLGNFLQHAGQLYLIDGDAIAAPCPGRPLGAQQVEDNLAIFFAQLEPFWDELTDELLGEYLRVNPEPILDRDRLAQQVISVRQRRLSNWLAKPLRDCSAFAVERGCWRFCSVQRHQSEALAPLLANPDSAFVGTPSLKDGGSSSVTSVQLDDRTLVVKRYNIKGLGHWLRRCLRPSRAWHSWLAAHRLRFLGIATPEPLAMIESRFGPLRRRAWLVVEYCPGKDLLSLFDPEGAQLPPLEVRDALRQVMGQLASARISHGDLKATNLLWHAGQVWLIDLDAMQAHDSEAGWRRAWARDRARLIRNWPDGSAVSQWLAQELPQ